MPTRVRQVWRVSDAGIWCKTVGSGDNDDQQERVPQAQEEAMIRLQLIVVWE